MSTSVNGFSGRNLLRSLTKLCLRLSACRFKGRSSALSCMLRTAPTGANPHPYVKPGEPQWYWSITHCHIREALGQEARFLVRAGSEALLAQSRVKPAQNCSPELQLELEVEEMWDSAQVYRMCCQLCPDLFPPLSVIKILVSRTRMAEGLYLLEGCW